MVLQNDNPDHIGLISTCGNYRAIKQKFGELEVGERVCSAFPLDGADDGSSFINCFGTIKFKVLYKIRNKLNLMYDILYDDGELHEGVDCKYS